MCSTSSATRCRIRLDRCSLICKLIRRCITATSDDIIIINLMISSAVAAISMFSQVSKLSELHVDTVFRQIQAEKFDQIPANDQLSTHNFFTHPFVITNYVLYIYIYYYMSVYKQAEVSCPPPLKEVQQHSCPRPNGNISKYIFFFQTNICNLMLLSINKSVKIINEINILHIFYII